MANIDKVFNGYITNINDSFEKDEDCKIYISCDNLKKLTRQIAQRRLKIIMDANHKIYLDDYLEKLDEIKNDVVKSSTPEEKKEGQNYIETCRFMGLYDKHIEADNLIKIKKKTLNEKKIRQDIQKNVKVDFDINPHIDVSYQKAKKVGLLRRHSSEGMIDPQIIQVTKEGKLRIEYTRKDGMRVTIDKDISRLCNQKGYDTVCNKNTAEEITDNIKKELSDKK